MDAEEEIHKMLGILCALLAADFVRQLTPEDLKPLNPKLPRIVTVTGTSIATCSIPLKEMHAGNGKRIDPIALPTPPTKFDESIKHHVPIPTCVMP